MCLVLGFVFVHFWGFFVAWRFVVVVLGVFLVLGFFLIKLAEMLGENSETGTPSSDTHAVEPLALPPLSVHPLSDTECCVILVYPTFLQFCSVFTYPLSSLCL